MIDRKTCNCRRMNAGVDARLHEPTCTIGAVTESWVDHIVADYENGHGDACGHASDCGVHNRPAYPNGPCTCGKWSPLQQLAARPQAVEALAQLLSEGWAFESNKENLVRDALLVLARLGGTDDSS